MCCIFFVGFVRTEGLIDDALYGPGGEHILFETKNNATISLHLITAYMMSREKFDDGITMQLKISC
jgi:hypothetical protein